MINTINLKIFRIYNQDQKEQNQIYNISDMLNNSVRFLRDQIFEINLKDSHEGKNNFKFVQLKFKEIKKESDNVAEDLAQFDTEENQKILFQIIDVSDKILYQKANAEKSFLTLINATVSHELRNPLNSLIGQITNMTELL